MSDIPNPLAAFDIFSARVDEKKQKKVKAKPWNPSRHYLAPKKKRLQIKTLFLLSIKRKTLFNQLPRDMLCVIATFLS